MEYEYMKRLNILKTKIDENLINTDETHKEFNAIIELFHNETNIPKDPRRCLSYSEFKLLQPLKFGIKYLNI